VALVLFLGCLLWLGIDPENQYLSQKFTTLTLTRIPLSKRPIDIAIIIFFFINLFSLPIS
jgi:hypothetical protein